MRNTMDNLHQLAVSVAAEKIKNGELSAVDLMESFISRSDQLNPELQIWASMDAEVAINKAVAAQKKIEIGKNIGPLEGIPIGVKDIFLTNGIITSNGSPIYASFVPQYDATSVARLVNAGGIVMGKTITTEFASFDPPATRNPWNVAHTPGGSSSGSAAGVAAQIFPTALGSQTSGSVLRPASYNGVIGMKPTFGRVSRYGVTEVSPSLDTVGFFVRSIRDAAIILENLAGYDFRDNTSSKLQVPEYQKIMEQANASPYIGILREFFFETADNQVKENIEPLLKKLEGSGAIVEDIEISTDIEKLLKSHNTVMDVELAVSRFEDFSTHRDKFGPNITTSIESGLQVSATSYLHAQEYRKVFRQEITNLSRKYDVILTPSTATVAPADLTTTGDPSFQAPWTTAGLPAISIPSGLSKEGLPLGIQLVAAPFAEDKLLQVAQWCENIVDLQLEPPIS